MKRWLVLAFLSGCAAQPAARADEGMKAMSEKTPRAAKMVEGPRVQDSDLVLKYLKQQTASGQRRLFRIPVVIRFKDHHRLEIESCVVGVAEEALAAKPVRLRLDDSGLGTDIITQTRSLCTPSALACAVWIDGFFGPLLDLPGLSERTDAWPFAVVRVVRAVDPEERDAKLMTEEAP